MKIIAIYNIKGGVGKTSTAVNLAHRSASAGARTLIWDLDLQAASTFYFRVRPRIPGGARGMMRAGDRIDDLILGTDYEGLEILPADFSHRNLDLVLDGLKRAKARLGRLLKSVRDQYDHVYIDCAPSISVVSDRVFDVADLLLVPTIPTVLSLRTLQQLREHLAGARAGRRKVRPFFCMVDRRRTTHRDLEAWERQSPFPFLRTVIPYASIVEQMGRHRAPVAAYAAGSAPARAYERLWREALSESRGQDGWIKRPARTRRPSLPPD